MHTKSPIVLMILDGWGYNPNNQYNAIAQAHTPQWDEWWNKCPHILLEASGQGVGLPDLQMGNSEVGHMHIGAGRIIQQDFTRINESITNRTFFENKVFLNTLEDLKQSQKTLHIMGMLSPGGVHSHQAHLFALLDLCAMQEFDRISLHLFLDGRDTPPQSALAYIQELEFQLQKNPNVVIGSICGRSFAMDRDNRWERIERVYNLLTDLQAERRFDSASDAILYYYENQISDEFIPPSLIGAAKIIDDGDAVLFFNYRSDRARELTAAFTSENFPHFPRNLFPKLSAFISMTQYDQSLPTTCAFPPQSLENSLGQILAIHGFSQLRIAETEKYAHVTFFFNGGLETIFTNEDRIMIPSPKINHYGLQPEMSAPELTDNLIAAIKKGTYDVIICNYANADMVGHTGNMQATIQAVECLDHCMSKVWQALQEMNGKMLITADHGNAEAMFDEHTHQAHTAHTSEPVPLVFLGNDWFFNTTKGSLIDIAPTVLALLGIEQPHEMTGHTLLVENTYE